MVYQTLVHKVKDYIWPNIIAIETAIFPQSPNFVSSALPEKKTTPTVHYHYYVDQIVFQVICST